MTLISKRGKINLMKDKKTIKPEKAGGFLDYLPETMIVRQRMLDIIRKTFESYGFLPLDTPAIEKLEVLTGNDPDFNMNLYRTAVVPGLKKLQEADNENLALRFDLTVPLTRVIASYPDKIIKPFKRYQIGRVWRGERQQAGRFREFTQVDADIIGTRSVLADTEIISLAYQVMKSLGFDNFLIKLNNRKILNSFLNSIGVEDKDKKSVLRIIDKKEKITLEELQQELEKVTKASQKILDFINLKGEPEEVLSQIEKAIETEEGKEGITELKKTCQNLQSLEINSQNWTIDLSVARGLSYYTGLVFETFLTDLDDMGSVLAGGRFDGLTNRFVTNSNIAGIGASVGFDRLFAAAEKLGKIKTQPSLSQVLVAVLDKDLQADYLKLAQKLRQAGFRTEIFLDFIPLKEQLIYAAKQEIPIIIIMGADEKKENTITIKDIRSHEQEVINQDELIEKVDSTLKE